MPDPGLIYGIERMRRFGFRTVCMWCGRSFIVDIVAVVLRQGDELIGLFCGECASPTTRENLARAADRHREQETR